MPRSSLLLLLALPSLAGRAAAQGFEGTITMTIASSARGQANDITVRTSSKGDRSLSTMTMASNAGPMAGMEIRSIADRAANTMTILTPFPAGMQLPPAMTGGVNARGFKVVVPLSGLGAAAGGASDARPVVRKLGTTETIAGMSCDDYEVTGAGATPFRACITTALGTFTFPMSGQGMGRGGPSASPEWARAFGDKPGFPLKVWSADGKVALQVTAIERNPVPESAFEIPEGFVTMPGRGG